MIIYYNNSTNFARDVVLFIKEDNKPEPYTETVHNNDSAVKEFIEKELKKDKNKKIQIFVRSIERLNKEFMNSVYSESRIEIKTY